MKFIAVVFLVFPLLALAAPRCKEGTLIGPNMSAEMAAVIGSTIRWSKNAVSCSFGRLQVIAPKNGKADEIIVLLDGKPFIAKLDSAGINLFQSYGGSDPIPFASVQDRNDDGVYETLFYSLVGKNGIPEGTVLDRGMTGHVKVIHYKSQNKPNNVFESDSANAAAQH